MKPTRYQSLMRAVEDVVEPTEEEWDEITERAEELREP